MSRKTVTLVEMGVRDGLQNEKAILDPAVRTEFIRRLTAAGVRRVEAGAFVRPDRIPQMTGSREVIEGAKALQKKGEIYKDVQFSVLVPNETGMRMALETGVSEVAVFAACSESFSLKNINCSIEESFERFVPVIKLARQNKIRVRGYLSTCFGCPFEGDVSEKQVVKLAKKLNEMGVFEISIGDTIGVATPAQVKSLFKKLLKVVPARKLAGHFHDTRGMAVANIMAAWELGVRVFDTSLGGLGGCPYAPGATGNVATEDVVYMFEKMGVSTGLDLEALVAMNPWVAEQVQHPLPSRVGRVGVLKPLGKVERSMK